MCGITGFFDFGEKISPQFYPDILKKMSNALQHRGPDGEGVWYDQSNKIGLGFRRLSILDLSSNGNQPMQSHDGRYVIAFNGEVYNFKALKKEISTHSISWKSSSDTEVLLEAISIWGLENALKKTDGMFALALWDKKEKKLSFARDRFGEKPLYYGWVDKTFLFASELKSIRTFPGWKDVVDIKSFSYMLRYGFISSPHSIYKGFYKLQPGSILTVGLDGKENIKKYWDIKVETSIAKQMTERFKARGHEETFKNLEELLILKISNCLNSDVPLGVFLSGGVDSTLITAIARKVLGTSIKSYTVGFEDAEFDESVHAKKVADYLETDHTSVKISNSDVLNIVEKLPKVYDEPFTDKSIIPTNLLTQITKQGVTVSLSGDGGDELFGGYITYKSAFQDWVSMIQSAGGEDRLSGFLKGAPYLKKRLFELKQRGVDLDSINKKIIEDLYLEYYDHRRFYGSFIQGAYLGNNYLNSYYEDFQIPEELNPTEKLFYVDSCFYLPENLEVKIDRASMAQSLEVRAPFLDKDIFSFASALPFEWKLHPEYGGKLILRKILASYVPVELTERPKQGFGAPIEKWLRTFLRPWAESFLNKETLKDHPYINSENLLFAWKEHLRGKDYINYLWPMLVYLQWNKSLGESNFYEVDSKIHVDTPKRSSENKFDLSRDVLHVVDSFSTGGAESTLVRFLIHSRPNGGGMPVISFGDGPLKKILQIHNIPFVFINRKDRRSLKKLLILIDKLNPKIIQTWLFSSAKDLVALKELMGTHKNFKLCVGIRDALQEYIDDRIIYTALEASQHIDEVIVNSHAGKKGYTFLGFSPDKEMKVIHNGLDPLTFKQNLEKRKEIRKLYGISDETTLVLCAARYSHMKGQQTFVISMQLIGMMGMKNIKAICIGRDNSKMAVPENLIAMERVDNVKDFYSAADIIICPTSCGEGFPNALAEGMLCECIPITTNTGDAALVAGDVGKVVVPHNYSKLAQAIVEVSSLSEEEKEKRKKAAREHIIKSFPIEKMIEEHEKFYAEILENKVS